MKWHIKIHKNTAVRLDKKELTIFLLWGYPYVLRLSKVLLLEVRQNGKRTLENEMARKNA